MTYKFQKSPVVFRSPNIDFLATGTTVVFTPDADFIVTQVIFYGVDVTDLTVPPVVTFGTNSPDFDNWAPIGSSITATGDIQGVSTVSTPGPWILSGGSALTANVTGVATATTDTQRIDFIGYYLN